MEFKAKYDEIDKICKTIKSDSEKLNLYIEQLEIDSNELATIWTGNDSNVFCEKLSTYLDKLKDIPKVYDNFEKTIEKASKLYAECDSNFAKNIKEVVIENE